MSEHIDRRLEAFEGIWADVKVDITLEPHSEAADCVRAVVVITARNQTPLEVQLLQPYSLPARKVLRAHATTLDGRDLTTKIEKDKILVYFTGVSIPAGDSFAWRIAYERMTEGYIDGILAYDRHIDSQSTFQDLPVRDHRFTIRFFLEKPSGRRWGALKSWRIHQRNTLRVHGRQGRVRKEERTLTTYDLNEFHLFPDQPTFDIQLACVYDWVGWIAHAVEIVVAASLTVALEHAPALLIDLWGKLHHK